MNTIHIYMKYLEVRPALANHYTCDSYNSYLMFPIVLPSTLLNHNHCVRSLLSVWSTEQNLISFIVRIRMNF